MFGGNVLVERPGLRVPGRTAGTGGVTICTEPTATAAARAAGTHGPAHLWPARAALRRRVAEVSARPVLRAPS